MEYTNDHLVGSYVWSVYNNINNNKEISGDINMFYFVLGWHIHQSYPIIYEKILNSL